MITAVASDAIDPSSEARGSVGGAMADLPFVPGVLDGSDDEVGGYGLSAMRRICQTAGWAHGDRGSPMFLPPRLFALPFSRRGLKCRAKCRHVPPRTLPGT